MTYYIRSQNVPLQIVKPLQIVVLVYQALELTSNYYHFLDPPNLQILWPKFGNSGAARILAAPGFANLEGPNWEILRILANFWSS